MERLYLSVPGTAAGELRFLSVEEVVELVRRK